jgi:hypothetical protein
VPEPERPRVPGAVPAQLVTVTRVGMRRFRGLEAVGGHDGDRGNAPGPRGLRDAVGSRGRAGRDVFPELLDPPEPTPARLRPAETPRHLGRTGSTRRPVLLAAAGALLVAVAIAKPWAWSPGGPPAVAGAPATSPASPAAYPSAGDGAIARRSAGGGITGFVGMGAPWDGPSGQWSGGADWRRMSLGGTADPLSCMMPAGWRLVVDEMDAGGPTASSPRVPSRSWLPALPKPAAGPSDSRVPFVRVASRGVTAMGVCAASHALAGREVTVWRLVAANPVAGPSPRAVVVARLPVPDRAEGVISLPVLGDGECGSSPLTDGCVYLPAWPAGRYVLQIGNPGTGTTEGWMGLEVVRTAP